MYEKIKDLIPEGQEKKYEKLIREALFGHMSPKVKWETFRKLKAGMIVTTKGDWLGKLAVIFETDVNTIYKLIYLEDKK